jgi:amidophosphoribosyltransferase
MESKEKCGIVAVYNRNANNKEILNEVFLMMNALQHRGQEGCGISFIDKNHKFNRFVTQGLVKDLFSIRELTENNLDIITLIGHIRYSTTGSDEASNLQPFVSGTIDGKKIALAHNGNVVNAYEIRTKLMEEGHTFTTTTDSEVILHHIVKTYNKTLNIEEAVSKAINEFVGAFSIVLLFDTKIIAFRDKNGFRPLVYGKKHDTFYFASEDTALKCIEVFEIEEVKPGSIVIIDEGEKKEIRVGVNNLSHCIFELVYFAKPSSTVFNESVYNFRYECGKALAKYDEGEKFDYVVPIPDSGFIAALGYSQASQVPLGTGLVRSHFTIRSFIQPKQQSRDNVVKTKFFVADEIVKDKKIVLIDDSIVRGTTMKRIVSILRKHGAKEIHLRIASPPVKYPCYFGIDFPTEKELIANEMSIPEIANYIGVDSLKYLEVEDMMNILKVNKTNFCNACFSGKYPVEIDKNKLRKDIFES